MAAEFRHYLITRYNVPLAGWEKDKRGIDTRDEAWLSHRLELFSRFCVHGVLAQSNSNFEWLIYLDEQTPKHHANHIGQLIAGHAHLSVRYAKDNVECLADINQLLQHAGTPFVITSRLDNDDAPGIDYIQTIQEHFNAQHGTLINLLHGHGYDVLRHVAMRLRHIPQNAFMSLIEKCNPEGNHISIRGFHHDHPPSHFTIVNVNTPHAWLKIFHDRNLKSEAFGRPVMSNHFAKYYGISREMLPIDTSQAMSYFMWWLRDGIARKVFHRKPTFKDPSKQWRGK